MMLRWVVSNWLKQAATQTLRDVATAAAEQARGQDEEVTDPVDVPPCDVVLVFSLGVEAGGLVDLLRDCVTTRCATFVEHAGYLGERRVVLIESGVGSEAAAVATREAIELHRPGWLISTGFASALTADLKRGHVLMADEVVGDDDRQLDVDLTVDRESAAASKSLHIGRLASVDRVLRTPDERHALADQSAALACDMETIDVATVCRDLATRFLAIRLITDAVDDRLPPEIEQLLGQPSLSAKLGAVTGAVFKRPSSVKDMWRLKEDALKASDRLARFLEGVVAQLPESSTEPKPE